MEERKTPENSMKVVREWLEDMATKLPSSIDDLPTGFYDALLLQGLQVDRAEHGRLLCTLKVPPRLLGLTNVMFIIFEPCMIDKSRNTIVNSVYKDGSSAQNTGNFLHGGATAAYVDIIGSAAIFTTGAKSSGVSVEINVSYLSAAKLGEEIEIEAKVLRIGKAIAFVTVDLRKKKTGELIAQGRHTKYLAVTSKL